MHEGAIVLGVLVVWILLAGAVTLFTAETLLLAGLCAVGLGCVLGLPAGAYYHVLLHRHLTAVGRPPSRWWWRPTRYHKRLSAEQWAKTRPWFMLGGLGFVLSVAGGVLTGLAAVVSLGA